MDNGINISELVNGLFFSPGNYVVNPTRRLFIIQNRCTLMNRVNLTKGYEFALLKKGGKFQRNLVQSREEKKVSIYGNKQKNIAAKKNFSQ